MLWYRSSSISSLNSAASFVSIGFGFGLGCRQLLICGAQFAVCPVDCFPIHHVPFPFVLKHDMGWLAWAPPASTQSRFYQLDFLLVRHGLPGPLALEVDKLLSQLVVLATHNKPEDLKGMRFPENRCLLLSIYVPVLVGEAWVF